MDMPLTQEEQEASDRVANTILALTMMPGLSESLGTYKGTIDGKEVLILAAMSRQENGDWSSKPLAIVWTPTLHEMVEVPHATVVRDGR